MKYFTITELCQSHTAAVQRIDNTPTEAVKRNLTALVENILDPLRQAYGRPINVNSGYRCPSLNKAVGGAKNSQHLTGHAADITVGNKTQNKKLFDLIQSLKLPFDQLIDEKNFRWVHVSYDPARNRRQVLRL